MVSGTAFARTVYRLGRQLRTCTSCASASSGCGRLRVWGRAALAGRAWEEGTRAEEARGEDGGGEGLRGRGRKGDARGGGEKQGEEERGREGQMERESVREQEEMATAHSQA